MFSRRVVSSFFGVLLASGVFFVVSDMGSNRGSVPVSASVSSLESQPVKANDLSSSVSKKQVAISSKTGQVSSTSSQSIQASERIYQEFNDWLSEFSANQNDKDYIQEHIKEGVVVAKARRVVLANEMKKHPRRALSHALSFYEYSILPQEVKNLVEEPITVSADLNVFSNDSVNNKNADNLVSLVYDENSERHSNNVYLYGNRKGILSKNNLAVQGIRLGQLAVISDQAFQIVNGNDILWAEKNLSLANKDKKLDYYTNEDIVGEPVRAISEGKLFYFSNENNVAELNTVISTLEKEIGPNSHIVQRKTTPNNIFVADSSLQEKLAKKIVLASTWTETNKKVFFIRVDFSDVPGESTSKADLEAALNGAVSAQIVDFSYGKTDIEGATSGSQVLASAQVVRLPQTGSYYRNLDVAAFSNGSSELHADARAAFTALSTGIDLNAFDIVGIHFPDINIGYAGLATLGGGNHWLQNTTSTKVIVHEFGHNYGLSHANYWDTGGSTVIGAGSEIEYGDTYDTMGDGNGDFHIQGKTRLNWIPSSEWLYVSSTGTYRLYRFDQGVLNTNDKAIRLTKASNEYYWLGYRRDFTSNNVLQKGAYIVWQRPFETNSVLIDSTPSSADGKDDAGISMGRTYSDSTAGIHITPIQQGGSDADEWLDIEINIGAFAGNQNPTVILTAPNALTARTPLTFSASASDPDGDTLSYDWNFGDGVIHDSTSNLVHSWAVGGSYTVKITVSDMKGGIATQQINVTVTDPATQWTDMTSNQADPIVDVAASSTMAVAITNFAVIGYSAGDASWSELDTRTNATSGFGSNTYLHSIIYDGSQWVTVGEDYDFGSGSWKGAIYTSPNAITWTERYKNGNTLRGIATSGSALVAVGDNGEGLRSTDSGVTWSPVATGITTKLINISYGNSQFVAVGNQYIFGDLSAMATSPDGLSWTNQTNNSGEASSAGYSAIEYLNDKFIGAGVNSRLGYLENSGGTAFITTRSDREATAALMYGNGVYFAAGINQDNGSSDIDLISTDGKSWTQSPSTTSVSNRNSGVFFNNTFITVGNNGSIRQSGVVTAPTTDSDSDGNDDTVEINVPDATGSGTGDGNGDGTQDNSQADVASLKTYDDTHWLTFSNTGSADQSNFSTGATPISVPADDQLILGTTQYDIATTSGASVTIEVYVALNTEIQDYLLLGNDGEWAVQNAVVTHTGNKTKLVFSVTEGGNFDRDATANGTLQLAEGGVVVKSGLDAWPYAYLFGNVDLNTPTTAQSFSIKNTGSRSLSITTTATTGNDASEFIISNDTCTGQSLAADASCTVSASFQPTSTGSKSAMLTVTTDDPDNAIANIFLRNHEADIEESERRLPPVLNSFTIEDSGGQTVNSMQSSTSYTIKWSILGYHEDYSSIVAMFNCTGIADETSCGNSFGDSNRFEDSGIIAKDVPATNGIWFHGDVQSKIFTFSYTFTTPVVGVSTPIVIRFYRKNSKDQQVGNGSLSLIIPGNHADAYYDTTGRRVKNTINP